MKTEDMTKPQLVALAIALLGGEADYVDREDIAIKANALAPGRFNWRKYPERIDLEVVSVSLRDAKKDKVGALVVGSNSQGWMLSSDGVKWLDTVDIENDEGQVGIIYRRGSTWERLEAERVRLRTTKAYGLFVEDRCDCLSIQNFYEFARVNEYYQTKSRRRRFNVVENAVLDDPTLSRLWVLLKSKFAEEINRYD